MVVYYTGTGNSRYTAQIIADLLGDQITDATPYIKNGKKVELYSEKPWVFVSPTYGWRIPRIFQTFIESGTFKGNSNAYFVMTCGSEIGNAGKSLQSLCIKKEFKYMGVFQIIMPENYVAMFPVPGLAESTDIIRRAFPEIRSTVDYISANKCFPEIKISILDKLKSSIVNAGFYSLCVKSSKFYSTDDCISCGQCERLCPTNTIHIVNGKPIWSQNCTHCMACICYCPKEAIEYGRISIGKTRYTCPPYTP